MALKEYRKKRDFNRTPEPRGAARKDGSGHRYVIHKHDASRLHYDLRLELDGALKSWAVPKGPSFDPKEKRLAVHVEDHPIEYGSFEGTIPEDEYGGGTVMLWDQGEWEPIGDPLKDYRSGKLKFHLKGKRLKGGWTLVQMKGDGGKNWLLIKEKDDAARSESDYSITGKMMRSVSTNRTMKQIASDEASQSPSQSKKANNGGKRAGKGEGKPSRERAGKTAGIDPARLSGAVQSRMPSVPGPQLATLVRVIPAGEDWLHEIKFDGYRIISMLKDGKARLITRGRKDWTRKFSSVASAVEQLPIRNAILDGEIVVLNDRGLSDFQSLQNALRSNGKAAFAYYVFDLIHFDGYDLTNSPLVGRKALLENLLKGVRKGNGLLRYSDHIRGKGAEVYGEACRKGLEGVISKRADAAYRSARTRNWVKIKCTKGQEFVIGAYTEPGGSRKGFGALLLGYYKGADLIYAGRVGTGFDEAALKDMSARLRKHEQKDAPFANPPSGADGKGVHWVKPQLVCVVDFTEWTRDGHLRHPSFKGLREDKDPKEVVREEPQAKGGDNNTKRAATASPSAKARHKAISGKSRPATRRTNEPVTVAGVGLTNPDRVLFPNQAITKESLARFYEAIADWVLPHIVDRPLALVRCPQGAGGKCFFQKHLTESFPDALRGVNITEKDNGEDVYIALDDLSGLITLVQMGVLEIHPWGCRTGNIEKPDSMVFDLDPGPGVAWKSVIEGALLVRERLADVGLESFVKTSGGKGLHVVAPLTPRAGWDEVKEFARLLAEDIAAKSPDRYVATMSKARRKGRIFVDYLRNGRGATCVAAYSTRARRGAPVSTPVSWNELAKVAKADAYTVENLIKRLTLVRTDPWKGYFDVRQSLTQRMKKAVGM